MTDQDLKNCETSPPPPPPPMPVLLPESQLPQNSLDISGRASPVRPSGGANAFSEGRVLWQPKEPRSVLRSGWQMVGVSYAARAAPKALLWSQSSPLRGSGIVDKIACTLAGARELGFPLHVVLGTVSVSFKRDKALPVLPSCWCRR